MQSTINGEPQPNAASRLDKLNGTIANDGPAASRRRRTRSGGGTCTTCGSTIAAVIAEEAAHSGRAGVSDRAAKLAKEPAKIEPKTEPNSSTGGWRRFDHGLPQSRCRIGRRRAGSKRRSSRAARSPT